MEDKLNNLITDARRIALTAEEKAFGREMLRSYMALTPVRTPVEAKRAVKAPFRFALFGRAAGVAGLVSTLLASAAGVSYAAEGSLPGDVLYSVKVGINEELRVALAPNAEGKAKVEAERAERRLAEAEALAKKGALKAETRVALEGKFKAHAENAKMRIEKAGSSVEADAAAEVAAHLESTLDAHGKIIAALEAEDDTEGSDDDGDRRSRREEKKREVAALALTIKAEARAAAEERGRDAEARAKRGEAEASAKAEARADEKRRNAERRRAATEKKINEVRAYLVKMSAKLGAEATAEAQQRLIVAEGVVGEGNAKLAAGDVDAAVELYVRAQKIAQEAKPLIRARGDLKVKVRIDVGDDESKEERRERSRQEEKDEDRRDSGARQESDDREDRGGRTDADDGIRLKGLVDVNVGI